MLTEYDGYEWGWIIEGGKREDCGQVGTGMPNNVVGIWGRVYRKDIDKTFYHETFLSEYRKETTPKSSWSERPLTMLQNLNREQCLNFAYPEDSTIPNEIILIPEQEIPKVRKLQLWECKKCGHAFYTPTGPKQAMREMVRHLWKPLRAECEVCNQVTAKKVKKVTKEMRE
jgi:hypothetical protein